MTPAPIPEQLPKNRHLAYASTQKQFEEVFADKWTKPDESVLLILTPTERIDPTLNAGWMSACSHCLGGCPDSETGLVECRRCDSTGLSEDITRTDCWWLVIRGGDSPMHPDWIRELVRQAERCEVPVWFEGWGAWKPVDEPLDAATPQILLQSGGHRSSVAVFDGEFEHPIGTQQWMAQVGSNNSGCVLDLQVFHQLPGGIR